MQEDTALLSTKAAADLLHVSDETLRRWVIDNKVRYIELPSGRLRFRRSDIEAMLEPKGGAA